MPIYSRKNLYRGVNAHLHSKFQRPRGGWGTFHTKHIGDLAAAIDAVLPSGYVTNLEAGFQIREYHPDTGEQIIPTRREMIPDLVILEFASSPMGATGTAISPSLMLSVEEALERDARLYLPAIVIREIVNETEFGKAITWLELLSPTNKQSGGGAFQYREKRTAALENGIALVELDYLHESHPVITWLPSYADHDEGAFPYTITITNPRPNLTEGQMALYGFGVDEPLPTLFVPLKNDDSIAVDFGAVYNRTFESLSVFSNAIDYAELPVNFDRYTPADQERIHARMAAVAQSEDAR